MYVYQSFWSHCWLQAVDMRYIYWNSCLISAHILIGIVELQGNICCWHLYGSSMIKKTCCLLFFYLYVKYCLVYMQTKVAGQLNIYVQYSRHIFSQPCGNNVKCMYTSASCHIVHCMAFIWGVCTEIVVSYMHVK